LKSIQLLLSEFARRDVFYKDLELVGALFSTLKSRCVLLKLSMKSGEKKRTRKPINPSIEGRLSWMVIFVGSYDSCSPAYRELMIVSG